MDLFYSLSNKLKEHFKDRIQLLFVANDVIIVTKDTVYEFRRDQKNTSMSLKNDEFLIESFKISTLRTFFCS